MRFKRTIPYRAEWLSFASTMPVFAIWLNHQLLGGAWIQWNLWWFTSYAIVLITGLATWYAQVSIMHYLRVALPDVRQTGWRLLLLTAAHLALIIAVIAFLFNGYRWLQVPGYSYYAAAMDLATYGAVTITLIGTAFWESSFTFNQLKKSLGEKERLEQLTLQHEFDTLKSQVNPHFLFNCFNTLSSLISEDKKQAEIFLDELSKVYRYLLKNNEDTLTTLQKELQFIESYYKLLRTRHGCAVKLNIDTDEKYHSYELPTLSLQLLVENAVKHNVLSKTYPLVIDIFTTEGNNLVVTNNLQPRSVKAHSNRIGLENIRQKYMLLQKQGFQVMEDKHSFTVILPLIWNRLVTVKPLNPNKKLPL